MAFFPDRCGPDRVDRARAVARWAIGRL